MSLNGKALTHGMRICLIEFVPNIVAYEHYVTALWIVLVIAEDTAQGWLYTEHCWQACGHILTIHLEAATWANDTGHGVTQRSANLEPCSHGITQLQHVGIAQAKIGPGAYAFDPYDAARLNIRQRTQQYSAQDGEDGDICTQAQRQHGHRGEGETRRVAQLAQCVTQVLKNRSHGTYPFY
jgi:hypothetical protein